jgi:hypothetical protein
MLLLGLALGLRHAFDPDQPGGARPRRASGPRRPEKASTGTSESASNVEERNSPLVQSKGTGGFLFGSAATAFLPALSAIRQE